MIKKVHVAFESQNLSQRNQTSLNMVLINKDFKGFPIIIVILFFQNYHFFKAQLNTPFCL